MLYICFKFTLFLLLGKWVASTLHLEPNRTALLPVQLILIIFLKVSKG